MLNLVFVFNIVDKMFQVNNFIKNIDKAKSWLFPIVYQIYKQFLVAYKPH